MHNLPMISLVLSLLEFVLVPCRKSFASTFLSPSFPLVILLLSGFVVGRYTHFRRLGQRTKAIAALVLILSLVPLTAKIMFLPLFQWVTICRMQRRSPPLLCRRAEHMRTRSTIDIRVLNPSGGLFWLQQYRQGLAFHC